MAIIPTPDFSSDKSLAFFTRKGIVKRTSLSEFSNIRNNGVRSIVLDENDEVVTAQITLSSSKFLMVLLVLVNVLDLIYQKLENKEEVLEV